MAKHYALNNQETLRLYSFSSVLTMPNETKTPLSVLLNPCQRTQTCLKHPVWTTDSDAHGLLEPYGMWQPTRYVWPTAVIPMDSLGFLVPRRPKASDSGPAMGLLCDPITRLKPL